MKKGEREREGIILVNFRDWIPLLPRFLPNIKKKKKKGVVVAGEGSLYSTAGAVFPHQDGRCPFRDDLLAVVVVVRLLPLGKHYIPLFLPVVLSLSRHKLNCHNKRVPLLLFSCSSPRHHSV